MGFDPASGEKPPPAGSDKSAYMSAATPSPGVSTISNRFYTTAFPMRSTSGTKWFCTFDDGLVDDGPVDDGPVRSAAPGVVVAVSGSYVTYQGLNSLVNQVPYL
jgi:hypothetical protein